MTRVKKYIVGFLITAGFCVLCIQSNTIAAEIKRGGTLRVGIDEAPLGWDPHLAAAKASSDHYEQIYEGLVQLNPKGEIVPWLATSWEQPDPLTIIFNLRRGVKFHNGREMVAEDVKYSLDRIKNEGSKFHPSYYDALKSVEVVDKHVVRCRFSAPDAIFLPYMASGRWKGIVPREVVEKNGDLKSVACGTGPFKLKTYVPGDYSVYERNPDYWEKGFPIVDELIFKVIKDDTSRLAALRRGSIDVGWLREAQEADLARKSKGLQVIVPPMGRYMWVWFRHDRPPFNNKKLRQAVSCAIDRDAMVKTILMGFGDITAHIPPSTAPFALSRREILNLLYYGRDVEQAKQLMKEAGYPNGFEFSILTSNHGPDYVPTAEMIQSYCRDVGIKVKIEVVEWGIQLNRWRAGDFQCDIQGGVWEVDPDHYIRPYLYTGAGGNYYGYSNKELDRLLDESRITVDVKKRTEIWKKIQYLLAKDVAFIAPQVGPTRFEVVQDYVKDYFLAEYFAGLLATGLDR